MNLVDSCGWLEYFADGKNAAFYAAPLQGIKKLIVPSICIHEVFKKILMEKGEDAALQAVALMHQGHIAALDANVAVQSAKLSYKLKIPLADSVVLAVAENYKAVIWTQDKHFKGIKGVKYIEN